MIALCFIVGGALIILGAAHWYARVTNGLITFIIFFPLLALGIYVVMIGLGAAPLPVMAPGGI